MTRSYDRMRDLLSDRPVAYHPQLAKLLGAINAALLFQQVAYWSNLKADSEPGYGAWIWKTQSELEDETAMTRYEQEGARKVLRRKGVIEEARRGIPAKLHYRICWYRFFELLENSSRKAGRGKPPNNATKSPRTGMQKSSEPGRGRPTGEGVGKPQSTTESTQRGNPENKAIIKEDPIPKLSEAKAAWLDTASSFIESGRAPDWFAAWCVSAELSGATLLVRLPVSRKVKGETFADIVRSECGEDLALAWRAVSGDPHAVLELEAGGRKR